MGAHSQFPTQAQAVALHWGAHLEVACAGLPGKYRYVSVVSVRVPTTSETMLNQHGVIIFTTVLLPLSPVDNSRMAGHYRQTLPVMLEVYRTHTGR